MTEHLEAQFVSTRTPEIVPLPASQARQATHIGIYKRLLPDENGHRLASWQFDVPIDEANKLVDAFHSSVPFEYHPEFVVAMSDLLLLDKGAPA